MEIEETINFSQFNEQQVRRMFGLKQELKENLLEHWEERSKSMTIDEDEEKALKKLQRKLSIFVRSWNEEELKLKVIGNLIELIDFDNIELEFVAFSERPLRWQYKNIELKGNVDLMVAMGISQPEQPFFFIHEYKREKDSSGDPAGQLLSAMFVANELNKQPKPYTLFSKKNPLPPLPIYGAYVIGRLWFFVVLNKNRYTLSKSYDSTDIKDLRNIFKILKSQKQMIVEAIQKLHS